MMKLKTSVLDLQSPNETGAVHFASGWTKPKLIQRARASALHFCACLLIAVCITLPLVFWLYPAPFFQASGGMNLLGIILVIDVVIGPVLTFLVFDREKKSLRKDLWVIAGLQIAALLYGLYVTAMSRPVFMTYVVDRYEMVSAADVDDLEFQRAPKSLKRPRWGHPEIAYAEQPVDQQERSTIMFSALNGVDLNRLFRFYKNASLAKPKIVERAKPIQELNSYNSAQAVKEATNSYSKIPLAFVPVQGKKRDLTALVDAKTGDLIEVVDLRPWPDSK